MPEYEISPTTPVGPYSRYSVSEVIPGKKLSYWNMGVIQLVDGQFVYQPQNEDGQKAAFQIMRKARDLGINVTRVQPFKR